MHLLLKFLVAIVRSSLGIMCWFWYVHAFCMYSFSCAVKLVANSVVSWMCEFSTHIGIVLTEPVKNHMMQGACSSIVGWGTMLKAGRSCVRFPMRSTDFSIDLILPFALWAWSWLSLWQKWLPGIFLGLKGGRPVCEADNLSVICELTRKCGSIHVSQPYGSSQAVTGITYL
jgi:hypothetical protein